MSHTDTREKILHTFNTLIEKGDFHSVTVRQIVSQAGISRATFYRHFKDKYDVMNYNYEHLLDTHMQGIHTLEELFLRLLQDGKAYWKPLLPLFETEGANSLFRFIRDYSFNAAKNMYEYGNMKGEGKCLRKMNDEEILQLRMFTSGAASMYEDWIAGKIPMNAEETASAMAGILPVCLRGDLSVTA